MDNRDRLERAVATELGIPKRAVEQIIRSRFRVAKHMMTTKSTQVSISIPGIGLFIHKDNIMRIAAEKKLKYKPIEDEDPLEFK